MILKYCLLVCIFYSNSLFSQLRSDSLTVIDVKPQKGAKKYHCLTKRTHENKNRIILSFFNFFEDTIEVYLKDKLISKSFVSYDTSIVSTKYTGYNCIVNFEKRKEDVYIVSKNKNVKIKFKASRKFPYYTISIYDNVWYVSARKCFPMIL